MKNQKLRERMIEESKNRSMKPKSKPLWKPLGVYGDPNQAIYGFTGETNSDNKGSSRVDRM